MKPIPRCIDSPGRRRMLTDRDSATRNAMSMTMTEQILARAAGRDAAVPGANIRVHVDVLITHDACAPGTLGVFTPHSGKDPRVPAHAKDVLIHAHDTSPDA